MSSDDVDAGEERAAEGYRYLLPASSPAVLGNGDREFRLVRQVTRDAMAAFMYRLVNG